MLTKKETQLVAYGVAAQTLMLHLLVGLVQHGKLEISDATEIIDRALMALAKNSEEHPAVTIAADMTQSLLAMIGGEGELRRGSSN